MKKLVSIALASVIMAFSASAFADANTSVSVAGAANNVTSFATTLNDTQFPGFKPGDTLNFTLTGLTAGKQLTLISYKVNNEGTTADLSNTTIQYINQYTATQDESQQETTVGAVQQIAYTIRDIEEGIYKIAINDGTDSENLTFFYKVGNPKVELVKGTEDGTTTDYILKQTSDDTYSVAFVAKATLGADVAFSDVGVKSLGFKFEKVEGESAKSEVKQLTSDQFTSIETNGSLSVYYGVTIYNIPNTQVFDINVQPLLIENNI